MGFLRRVAGLLGFVKDENHELKDEEDDDDATNTTASQARNRSHFKETGLPRKGFSVPVQVAVDRSQPGPLLARSDSGDGGVQGLRWYAKRLRMDEDGDVADEFFDEVTLETSSTSTAENERTPFPRFQVKYSTRPAKVKKQVLLHDGRIQQYVEHQGRLQLV
ncbi:phospholipid hydroperoxide glutathione peroxidase [Parasponia andersonii]|uniref:Phospholipid hydroperoxide glutathione peroxidase n=1 Tax=Parasponia andersonii TaxID=3476 RepID=A0A2P5C7N7_PARAD|nr:phospholipid hydroperoxide glutathione peroxidase [Parasponia andersonii]